MTVPQQAIDAALDGAVRGHFDAMHKAGVCVPFEQIGATTRRVVRNQLSGTVTAALTAAEPFMRAEWEAELHGPDLEHARSAGASYKRQRDALRAQLAALTAQLQTVRELGQRWSAASVGSTDYDQGKEWTAHCCGTEILTLLDATPATTAGEGTEPMRKVVCFTDQVPTRTGPIVQQDAAAEPRRLRSCVEKWDETEGT